MICIPKDIAEKIKIAIRDGRLSPDILNKIKDSSERRNYFAKIVGEENAKGVNLLFEKKLLLKNQEKAMYDMANELLGNTKDREELSAKIKANFAEKKRRVFDPKEDEAFLDEIASDIYSKKYKTEVSLEEAQKITELTQDLKVAKEKMKPDFTWETEKDRSMAGGAERALNNYVSSLKSEATQAGLINPFREKGVGNIVEAVIEDARISIGFIAQTSRSIVAGILDNSFWGNQGIKVMWNPGTSKIWAKNFLKSFMDIGKILKGGVKEGDKIMDGVYADFYTRKNRLNGRYDAKVEGGGDRGRKLDIGTGEEEIPTDIITKLGDIPILSKIPILKQALVGIARMSKAASVAYEAGAMRLRMDIADKYYEWSEKAGKDLADNQEVGSINTVINSITGRGSIGSFEKAGKPINWVVFSVKFVKSNLDFLTAHIFDKNVSPAAKWRATKNLLTVVSMIGATLGIAKALDPDSTDLDSRSSSFGKIYGQDITGGMASYAVLASRIARQASKSSNSGVVSPLGTGYGQMSGWDVFVQFLENKTSPMATVVKDLMKQETFEGDKPTLFTELKGLATPMGLSNTVDIINEKDANLLLKILSTGLNFIGLNKNVYNSDIDWGDSMGKELEQFKSKVGDTKFQEANDKFNQQYNDWLKSVKNVDKFRNLSSDDQKAVITKKKAEIKDKIFKSYGFKYKTPPKGKPLPKF